MKKSFVATLILAVATYFPAFSTTTPTIPKVIAKTKLVKEKVIELRLANLEKKYTYVSITDVHGELIYFSEGVKNHNGFIKAINISNLYDGIYLITVRAKGKSMKQIFKVDGDQVLFSNFK